MAAIFKHMPGIAFGDKNPGGVKQAIYFALVSDFDSIATYATPTSDDLAERSKITSPHTFLPGKGWTKLQPTKDKANLGMEYPKDFDVTGGKEVCKFSYPGNDENLSGFISVAPTAKVIALVPDTNGKLIQIGTELNPAQFMPQNHETGKTPMEYKGAEMQLEAYMDLRTFYSGADPEAQLVEESA